jgi:hypothetical protein
MTITTYHSSKGLECKVCILLNVDNLCDKKLLYVGMTRASKKLCIHSFSSGGGKVFKELLSCYNEMIAPVKSELLVAGTALEERNKISVEVEYPVKSEQNLLEEKRELRVNLESPVEKNLVDSPIVQKSSIKSALRKLGSFLNKVGTGSTKDHKLKEK